MVAMRRVVIVTYPGVQTLDVIGPAEVFSTATQLAGDGYELEVVAAERGRLVTSSVSVHVDRTIADCRGRIDTLIVAGGTGSRPAQDDEELIAWLTAAARRSRRVASVCTGALLLGSAGLLDGRRVTTHWAWCDYLARRYPAAVVDPEPIFVRDGKLATSAGVTAGMDLALALVEEDLGPEVALETARRLVLFLRRPGGQSQFSAQLAAQTAERPPLRDLQSWIPDHLDAGPLGASPCPSRLHERAQLRARLPARDGHDARGLRRGGAHRARPHCAGEQRPPRRGARPALRLRDRRDAAPSLSPPAGSEPGRLQEPLPPAGGGLTKEDPPMKIAIPLYERFTALDAIGPYEVLSRLPGASVTWLAPERGPVRSDNGMLTIEADAPYEDVPDPEILVVPGGISTDDHLDDERLIGWIRRAHETSDWTTSVCSGSLLLGAAGVLDGLDATSHWLDIDKLERFGARPTRERVVERGKVMTAAGVSAGIDMALTLASRISGPEVAQAIQLGIEYDPKPPFDAGSEEKAPAEIVDLVRSVVAARDN